jgi:hypothetical protein
MMIFWPAIMSVVVKEAAMAETMEIMVIAMVAGMGMVIVATTETMAIAMGPVMVAIMAEIMGMVEMGTVAIMEEIMGMAEATKPDQDFKINEYLTSYNDLKSPLNGAFFIPPLCRCSLNSICLGLPCSSNGK